MEFLGPTANDLDNVRALNRAYLALLRSSNGAASSSAPRLTARQAERLAGSPFLLFSLREHDARFWQDLLADPPQGDLVDSPQPPSRQLGELQAAGLAFLWQLVRRSPYAARVISGAPLGWCEQLESTTLVGLLERAAMRQIAVPRFDSGKAVWHELPGSGTSAMRLLRSSAHMRALQSMLTVRPDSDTGQVRAAACAMSGVAERGGPTKV